MYALHISYLDFLGALKLILVSQNCLGPNLYLSCLQYMHYFIDTRPMLYIAPTHIGASPSWRWENISIITKTITFIPILYSISASLLNKYPF